jgi:hypothetical protein
VEIGHIVEAFGEGLRRVDAKFPVGASGKFQPGCGPLSESEATALVLHELARENESFRAARPMRYPNSRAECDFCHPWCLGSGG